MPSFLSLQSCFLTPTKNQLAYYHRRAAERAALSPPMEDAVLEQDENQYIYDENSVESVCYEDGSAELVSCFDTFGY